MKTVSRKILLIYRIVVSIICTASLSYIIFINPIEGLSVGNVIKQLGHFSIFSLVIVTATFIGLTISQLLHSDHVFPKYETRGGALLYASVTTLVFIVFFYNYFDLHGFQKFVFYFSHISFALFILFDNILSIPPQTYTYDLLIYWLIIPFYYLIFLIVESYIFDFDRYQFLAINDNTHSFYPIAILLLAVVFITISVVIIFINRTKDLVKQDENK